MSYYMDYPDWFDTEWADFEKPCPECGGKMRCSPLFDQGCYEGMVYRCTEKKCGSQWVFRAYGYILPYWATPLCPACESPWCDYSFPEPGHTLYTCPDCTCTFKERYVIEEK